MKKFLHCLPSFRSSFFPKRAVFMGEVPSQADQQVAKEAIKAKAPELEKKGEAFQQQLDAMSDEQLQKLNVDTEAKSAKDDVDKTFQDIMNDPVVNPKLGEGKFYTPGSYETHADIQPLREARDNAKKAIEKAQEDCKEKQKEITDVLDLQRNSRVNVEEGFKTMASNKAEMMKILDSDPAKLKMEDIQQLDQKLKSVTGTNEFLTNTIYANLDQNLQKVDEMKFKDSLASVKFAHDLMQTDLKSFGDTFAQVDNASQIYKSASGFVEGMKLRSQANASNDATKFDQSKAMLDAAKKSADGFRTIRIGVPGAAPAEAVARVGTTSVEHYEGGGKVVVESEPIPGVRTGVTTVEQPTPGVQPVAVEEKPKEKPGA